MKKTCNIGFVLKNELSCFNAALGLAHALRERGRNTVFFVDDRSIFSPYVESHGFKAAKTASVDDSIKRNSIDLCFLDSIRNDIYPTSTLLAETGLPTILLSYPLDRRSRLEPISESLNCEIDHLQSYTCCD